MSTLNLTLFVFSLEVTLIALVLVLGHRRLHQRLTPSRSHSTPRNSPIETARRLVGAHETLLRLDQDMLARLQNGEDGAGLTEASTSCRRTILTLRRAASTLATQGEAAVPHCVEMLEACEALAGALGEIAAFSKPPED